MPQSDADLEGLNAGCIQNRYSRSVRLSSFRLGRVEEVMPFREPDALSVRPETLRIKVEHQIRFGQRLFVSKAEHRISAATLQCILNRTRTLSHLQKQGNWDENE